MVSQTMPRKDTCERSRRPELARYDLTYETLFAGRFKTAAVLKTTARCSEEGSGTVLLHDTIESKYAGVSKF